MDQNRTEQNPVAERVTCTRCGHTFSLQSITAVCPKCAAPVDLADPADVLLHGLRDGLPWLLAHALILLPFTLMSIVLGILLRLRGPGSYSAGLAVILLPLVVVGFLCLIVGVVRSTPTRAMPPGRTRDWGRLVRLSTLCLVGLVVGHAAAQPFAIQIYGIVVLLACLGLVARATTLSFLAIYLDLSVSGSGVCLRDLRNGLIVIAAAHAVSTIFSTVIEHRQYRASPEFGALMTAVTPYVLVASWALQVLTLLVLIAFLLRVRTVVRGEKPLVTH